MPADVALAGWSPMVFVLETVFNRLVTHVPVRRLRRWWLGLAGAVVDPSATVFCGVQVINARGLRIGARASVGSRTYLDARGGIEMEHDVNIGSDSHILTADHDLQSPGFEERYSPVRLADHATLGTRTLVLRGVTVGPGGAAAAGAVVNRDVAPGTIVGGVPARPIGTRPADLDYRVSPPPRLA